MPPRPSRKLLESFDVFESSEHFAYTYHLANLRCRPGMHSPVRLVLFTILLLPARTDEFDRLRMKWRDMLTGGAGGIRIDSIAA
jgi:hypothetical protein